MLHIIAREKSAGRPRGAFKIAEKNLMVKIMSNNTRQLSIFEQRDSNLIRTRSGIIIDSSQDVLAFKDNLVDINLNFTSLAVSNSAKESIKLTCRWYAENRTPNYLRNIFTYLSYLIKYINEATGGVVSEISCGIMVNYRSSLGERKEYHLGYIRAFLKRWHALKFPGISQEAIKLKGNVKGEAVRTLDKDSGPFSDLEFQAIYFASRTAYNNSIISLQDFLIVWFFMTIGRMPKQLASLRVSDFIVMRNSNGDITYLLNIPRIKQRDKRDHEAFKSIKIISTVGLLIEQHIQALESISRELRLPHADMPLFPRRTDRKGAPRGYRWHYTARSISNRLKEILGSMEVVSERTGRLLKINAQRFRYTLGTRMAMEGHPPAVLAEILDHTDTQNIDVYVANHPKISKFIDEATAMLLAPIAKAFLGEVVSEEDLSLSGIKKYATRGLALCKNQWAAAQNMTSAVL